MSPRAKILAAAKRWKTRKRKSLKAKASALTSRPISRQNLSGSQDGANLPEGAFTINNDAGLPGYLGSAPPAGHGPHRYVFAVHAMDCESLGIDNSVSNAIAGFNMFGKVLARATITPIYEQS